MKLKKIKKKMIYQLIKLLKIAMYLDVWFGIYLSLLFLNHYWFCPYYLFYNSSLEFIHFNFMQLICWRYYIQIISFQYFVIIYNFLYLYILKEVVKGVNLKFATFLFGLLRFILSFVATGMLHTYGRRPLCMISGIIMAITLLISGLCFHLKAIGNNGLLLIVYLMNHYILLCVIHWTKFIIINFKSKKDLLFYYFTK